MMMKLKASRAWPWRFGIAFCLVGLAWGTSFYWIKIALREINPVSLVAHRLGLAAMGLFVFLWSSVERRASTLRILRQDWFKLFLFALINPFLPFLLITWGETRIDSGLTAAINSTVPLITGFLAHYALKRHDPLSKAKALGLMLGFIGVLLLTQTQIPTKVGPLGFLAVLGAATCYATSTVFSRIHFQNTPAIVQSFAVLAFGAATSYAVTPFMFGGLQWPKLPSTWFALLWMGILGTAVALALYFRVLQVWGATRTATVNYILPMVAIGVGVVFLGEPISIPMLSGTGMIAVGIFFANR